MINSIDATSNSVVIVVKTTAEMPINGTKRKFPVKFNIVPAHVQNDTVFCILSPTNKYPKNLFNGIKSKLIDNNWSKIIDPQIHLPKVTKYQI